MRIGMRIDIHVGHVHIQMYSYVYRHACRKLIDVCIDVCIDVYMCRRLPRILDLTALAAGLQACV